MHRRLGLAGGLVLMAALMMPNTADAFCGFYVGGADAKLFNNATQVVMMREGTRTILSMQNNYEGPPSDFAMVVPVPVVLQKENVKTLPKDIFDKVDKMAAPRLVEYWEADPCMPAVEYKKSDKFKDRVRRSGGAPGGAKGAVKIEAQFEVGEYQIVVLSANDSGALDTWLRDNKYNIPKGAGPVLKPYVEAGTKFFVAKVNSKKVTFKDGKAVLSPLRFHYDSKDFTLPIRLGLLNAKGAQDVIVHILAQGQRYEAANYKNVTIPTNIGVGEDAKGRFGEFYAALFDRTLEKNPGAVITEYSWDASTCDPCPGPTLSKKDFMTLGADATPSKNAWGFVLTRIHARYTKDTLGEDLVFKAAAPIVGGRQFNTAAGELEEGSTPSSVNNFQGRYIIRHPWKGEVKCANPIRNRWGGAPNDPDAKPKANAAQGLAEATRGNIKLASVVRQDVPEIDLKMAGAGGGGTPKDGPKDGDDAPKEGDKGDIKAPPAPDEGGCAQAPGTSGSGSGLVWVALLGLIVAVRRRL